MSEPLAWRSSLLGVALATVAYSCLRDVALMVDGVHFAEKIERQIGSRGWAPDQIREAFEQGRQLPAVNKLRGGTEATRYMHPTTGQSVVIDDLTGEVIHVGGPGFRY